MEKDERFAVFDARFRAKRKALAVNLTKETTDERFRHLPNLFSIPPPQVDKYGRRLDGGFSEAESTDDGHDEVTSSDEEGKQDGESPSFSDGQESEDTESEGDASGYTTRVALKNLDWDKITATDIFALFQSFTPLISSVTVYPSSIGREHLAKELAEGPNIQSSLRDYYMLRLKFFYAVVEFEDVNSAKAVARQLQAMEVGASGNILDISSVPDHMSFDGDEIRDKATGVPVGYQPVDFVTSVLQETNIKDSWDKGDLKRERMLKRRFTSGDIEAMELQEYMADTSSSEDGGEETNKNRQILLAAIDDGGADQYDTVVGGKRKEIVSDSDAESSAIDEDGFDIEFCPEMDQVVRDAANRRDQEKRLADETTLDRFKRIEKEKRIAKKERRIAAIRDTQERATSPDGDAAKEEELDLLLRDEDRHFDMREVMRKEKWLSRRKLKPWEKKKLHRMYKEGDGVDKGYDAFKMDARDARFKEAGMTQDFAIEPTHPQYKNTRAMREFMEQRLKSR